MGEHTISAEQDEAQAQHFARALLLDLAALEKMLDSGWMESAPRRIGAEQEMFLVDRSMRPASINMQVLERAKELALTTEIGRFNLEANLTPRPFHSNCLQSMEDELTELVGLVRRVAGEYDAEVLLAGILPTLRQSDLTLDNLTPVPRYAELNRAVNQLRGNRFSAYIKGLDEINIVHDNVMLEACCTSFQVHLQVSAQEFVKFYNIAQAITAPVLAVAANSPLLFGHRLWHETRIALFKHSVDERSATRHLRGHPTRVSFGDDWVQESVLEIFRDDIARFRVILMKQIDEDALAVVARGQVPQLTALRLHNGTVWRWNRPCYGVIHDRPHLRIENRALPAGPTIVDEIANAAFFLGLMTALPHEYGEVNRLMAFDDVKENFFAAARHGLKAQFNWLNDWNLPAATLILEHLLPLARSGLRQTEIATEDSDKYLGIIEERARSGRSGAFWSLHSLAAMGNQGTREQRLHALTANMLEQQKSGTPVHQWNLAELSAAPQVTNAYQSVGQFMTTDLFTVRPDDLIDLAACVMDWRHIRHVPVEDDEGHLLGLVSHRNLLHLMAQGQTLESTRALVVKDIMKTAPLTVSPLTPTLEAVQLMRQHRVGCLPVLEDDKLVGIITAADFLALAGDLLEVHLKLTTQRKAIGV
ncbi:MAG: CBS domain-containing protein [Acidobacteria bacterium]|nr:CBS domain-containing protein [Acidobacteriota bacterium]